MPSHWHSKHRIVCLSSKWLRVSLPVSFFLPETSAATSESSASEWIASNHANLSVYFGSTYLYYRCCLAAENWTSWFLRICCCCGVSWLSGFSLCFLRLLCLGCLQHLYSLASHNGHRCLFCLCECRGSLWRLRHDLLISECAVLRWRLLPQSGSSCLVKPSYLNIWHSSDQWTAPSSWAWSVQATWPRCECLAAGHSATWLCCFISFYSLMLKTLQTSFFAFKYI